MSEAEFEKGNEELFQVVNDHAAPEATTQAEKIEEELKGEKAAAASEPTEAATTKLAQLRRKQMARIKWRFRLSVAGKILICLLVAALFAAALVDDRFVPVLCYIGLAACISILSVLIDRNTRGW